MSEEVGKLKYRGGSNGGRRRMESLSGRVGSFESSVVSSLRWIVLFFFRLCARLVSPIVVLPATRNATLFATRKLKEVSVTTTAAQPEFNTSPHRRSQRTRTTPLPFLHSNPRDPPQQFLDPHFPPHLYRSTSPSRTVVERDEFDTDRL